MNEWLSEERTWFDQDLGVQVPSQEPRDEEGDDEQDVVGDYFVSALAKMAEGNKREKFAKRKWRLFKG